MTEEKWKLRNELDGGASFPEMRVGYEGEDSLPESVFNRREAWRQKHWWRRLIPLVFLGRDW